LDAVHQQQVLVQAAEKSKQDSIAKEEAKAQAASAMLKELLMPV